MKINDLPYELLSNIFEYLLPDKSCNINDFKNYFLVNKLWNKILNSNTMLSAFSQKNKLYKQYKNEKFTYNSLINRLCILNILFKINPIFINIFSFLSLIHI